MPVAPSMSPQSSPSASQRCHWYARVAFAASDQVPGWAVSVLPTVSDPVIVGGAVFAGTCAAWKCASTRAAARTCE